MRALVIGVGECGGRLLDEFNRQATGTTKFGIFKEKRIPNCELETLAINTSPMDLTKLENTRKSDKLNLEEHGVGANRKKGKQAYKGHKEEVMEEIVSREPYDLSFLFTSLGGGTGSSFVPELILDLKDRVGINSYVVGVLPFREEGTIFIQNAGFALRDIIEAGPISTILTDNQFLGGGRSFAHAYKMINKTVAERFVFLLKVLNSEQIVTADLGDLEGALSAGTGLATLGYGKQRDEEESVKQAITRSMASSNLLFEATTADVGRALFLIWGDEGYLDTGEILDHIKEVGSTVGQPFRGVAIGDELPRCLSLLNLTEIDPVEDITRRMREAIVHEQEKKGTAEDRREEVIERIDRLEPEY